MLGIGSGGWGPVLKILYPKGLGEHVYKKCPLLGRMPKTTDFVGEAKAVVITTGEGHSGSAAFSEAQLNQEDPNPDKFLVTRVKDYAFAQVDAETMMASANDRGAIAKAIDQAVKTKMYVLARSAAQQAYSDGTGRRGTGDSAWTVTGNAITLLDIRDIVKFERGMWLNFESTGGVLRTGKVKVLAVNRRTGVITTVESNIQTAVPTVANSDHIMRAGDNDLCASGLAAWCPPSDPSATPFFGVDRTKDVTRLGGQRFTGTSLILEETLIDAAAQYSIDATGEGNLELFLHPMRLAQMNKSQYAKTIIEVAASGKSGVKYRALEMATPSGSVTMYPDPMCPYNRAWLLDMSSWELCSLGEFPHFVTDDGQKYVRTASADGIEFRMRAFWNILCKAPGDNMCITW